nr:PREDICTED: uncharacterized protein LOC103968777 isoform X2 [Musa acuminata subsp. malaccensis]
MRPIRPKSQIDRVPTRNAAKREGSGEGRHCRRQEGRLLGQEGVLLCCRCRCLRRSCFLPRGVWYDRLHFTLEDSMKLLTLFKMLRTCVTRETCGAKICIDPHLVQFLVAKTSRRQRSPHKHAAPLTKAN